ncbi:hypothetical protein [Acuticoccus kandeliae]|uniref:hypothetical protein n=1 Tax=Acuticoccus kandeliae TaxID=2073160 RepID=UPI001300902A|nr:hypothetical protein [Acuticoccus kandeliae]
MLKAAFVGVLAMMATASFAASPLWFADEKDPASGAKWGIPNSDAVGFVVSCNGPGRVAMRPALYAMEAVEPAPKIRFTVDEAAYEREAEFAFSKADAAWQAYAVVSRDDPLVDALRRGTEVTYDFDPRQRDGDAFTVSLSGSAEVIDQALEDC